MVPIYCENKNSLYMIHKFSQHFPPHLHETIEMIYITSGTLELGIEQELFHMEKGDFAIVFPNLVHHYQVFSEGSNSAIYVYPVVSATGNFHEELYKYQPKNPIISEKDIHRDVLNAILALNKEENMDPVIAQSYVQIILARCMPLYELIEKQANQGDTIYRTVSYIAAHFKEDITLNTMSKALAINKYALSRIFSGVFHTNFNQYVNEHRLNYVSAMLEYSDEPITNICLEAGFQSQRTFNRAFQDKFHMTPREYRNRYRERLLVKKENSNENM